MTATTAALGATGRPPPARFGTGRRRYRLAALVVFAALAALATDEGPVLCPIRRCSGGYCPGCGLTRSGGRLLRGDVAGSWAHHPFVTLAAVQAAAFAGLWRFGSPGLRLRIRSAARPVLAANVVAVLLIWLARLADGAIPAPFIG